MDLCLLLPIPADLWNKPHIYGTIGFFIGAAIGFYPWFENTRFNAKVKAKFGNAVYLQATAGVFGVCGLIVGAIVAFFFREFCSA